MHAAISLDAPFRSALLSALSAVLLADGRVDAREFAALEAAARALDLPSGPAALGAAMLGAALGADKTVVEELDPPRRALVYAAAEWMALADGSEDAAEIVALDELRRALGLGPGGAARLHELAVRVRAASSLGPTHAEFEALLIGARRVAEARAPAAI